MHLSRRFLLTIAPALLTALPALAADGEKDRPTLGTIERVDPRFDAIVPKDARVERIAEGYDWSEGPVWNKARGSLLFSDVPM